jgi:hypothetical protein
MKSNKELKIEVETAVKQFEIDTKKTYNGEQKAFFAAGYIVGRADAEKPKGDSKYDKQGKV